MCLWIKLLIILIIFNQLDKLDKFIKLKISSTKASNWSLEYDKIT